MDRDQIRQLANKLAAGEVSVEDFALQVESRTTRSDANALSLDLDRSHRCGFPEVVYAEGKTVETIRTAFDALVERGERAFATRVSAEQAEALASQFSTGVYNGVARTFRVELVGQGDADPSTRGGRGFVPVVTAGSTDAPVAEEARETLDWMGVRTQVVHDVGVAGPHRLPERLAEIADADAAVVVAGMEGALPSVVGGHVPCPVIAVPTSVGYGANLGGVAALLSMLNSCAANVTVVNIDAGFKAGYVAGLIATRRATTGTTAVGTVSDGDGAATGRRE